MASAARTLTDVLDLSARRTPDAAAVEGPETSCSYLSLDDASRRLAMFLKEAGVHPGDRVAVCLRKSPETVAAIFGILRAGAVFVPLDRSTPAKRLGVVARDCSPSALIGSGWKLREIAAAAGGLAAVIEVKEDGGATRSALPPESPRFTPWPEVMAVPPLESPVTRAPRDLAYILYTSGSTGIPKGVMISHENALAFTSWARVRFGVSPGDRVASVAPFHFDLSTFDLYSTLEGGATCVLVPEETALFPDSLAGYLEARRVTLAYLVPSVITGMLLHGNFAGRDLRSLRTILFAGEVFPPRYLSMLMEALPHVALFNLYGPTETNVCTYYEVRPEDRSRVDPIPIGIPASGDSLFAVDLEGKLITSPGREGEFFAAGPTVALGYWGDVEKTHNLFLGRHPHAPSGQRVYRTGDRVSIGAQGDWLYHGRGDDMVKSRGYRIELGDIEAALYGHDAVAQATVVAVPDSEIGNRIKACIVLKAGAAIGATAIQRHCASRLPRYMVPEIVEFLPSMPKTSSGKINRRRLAAPASGRAAAP